MQESKLLFKLNNNSITVELLVVCRIGNLIIAEDKFWSQTALQKTDK